MARSYPSFQQSEQGNGVFEVNVDGKAHTVIVDGNSFTIDGGSRRTCEGHPVLEDQGPGVPPAAVIAIVRGHKPILKSWATFWRGG